jgi:hypothetical protein
MTSRTGNNDRRALNMNELFDPLQLCPAASLNQARILRIPGAAIREDVIGKTGYELISASAVSQMIRRAEELELTTAEAALIDRDLPPCLDRRLKSSNVRVSSVVNAVVQQFAHNAAYVVLSMTHGRSAGHPPQDEWESQYCEHWSRIKTVIFGGGLTSGYLGERFSDALQTFWMANEFPAMSFRIAPHGVNLALSGAAHSVGTDGAAVLAFDFGGSFVKRGIYRTSAGRTSQVKQLEPLAAPVLDPELSFRDFHGTAKILFEFIVETIGTTLLEIRTKEKVISLIPVSLASYVRDGQPIARQGGPYSTLCTISQCASDSISAAVSSRVGTAVKIKLLHDGTAAAQCYAGLANAAVITLGTAIGVGFPPTVAAAT